MSQGNAVSVRFYPPPEDLRGCFTSFYVTELDPGEDGLLRDCLHPEWAGMRFFTPRGPDAWMDDGQRVEDVRFHAAGPTLHPIHFAMPKTRMWGFGFLPLGWARYVRLPAADHANTICDGYVHPFCAPFRPLADSLFGPEPDEAAELARIIAFFRNFRAHPLPEEKRIVAIHAALVDPEVVTVTDLVGRVAASQRTVERLCHRHFGFAPKLLLRRQRFMRSLAQFMLDPSLKWIGAMDPNYHDQAQFVRDFREFMGLSPREYSSVPHPVLERFLHERLKAQGAPVQTLDKPSPAPTRAV
ncbi:MAG: AraC family transcriptional regulator [Sphingomonadaceae bacterium]|nr:AraC family transcriptional regulator [Sphingomonadaceae bacterium]